MAAVSSMPVSSVMTTFTSPVASKWSANICGDVSRIVRWISAAKQQDGLHRPSPLLSGVFPPLNGIFHDHAWNRAWMGSPFHLIPFCGWLSGRVGVERSQRKAPTDETAKSRARLRRLVRQQSPRLCELPHGYCATNTDADSSTAVRALSRMSRARSACASEMTSGGWKRSTLP